MKNDRKSDASSFLLWAGGLLLLSLLCQGIAIWLFRSSPVIADEVGKPSEKLEVKETRQVVADAKQEERLLAHKYKKLKNLESKADFLEATAKELQLLELFNEKKKESGRVPYSSIIAIDTNAPDYLEKTRKFQRQRMDWAWDTMAAIAEFIELADFSCLTEEEYESFNNYVDLMKRWADIVYDDSVDLETKVKICYECSSMSEERYHIADKLFRNQYGAEYAKYQKLYENTNAMWSYLNPWWVNKTVVFYLDESGQQHEYRVKLFED